MLKKKERLTRHEFDRFFSVGKRLHTAHFQLIYAPSPTFHGSVVVGKKVYKKAVDRNKLRRQVYALLYRANQVTPLLQTLIIIAKPTIATLSRKELKSEVFAALEKVSRV